MPEQNKIAAEAITEQKSSIENYSADRNTVIDFLYASCVKASQNIEKNRIPVFAQIIKSYRYNVTSIHISTPSRNHYITIKPKRATARLQGMTALY